MSLKRLRTLELIESDQRWWDSYAERRLEPAGLLILQGQRMGAEDLYRYCIDMGAPVDLATEAADTVEIIDSPMATEEVPPSEVQGSLRGTMHRLSTLT